MSTETQTTQEIAAEAYAAFEKVSRGDETIDTIRDGSAEWIKDAVYDAHGAGRLLPDDWTYSVAREAFGYIADNDADKDSQAEFADQVDIYTAALTRWLAEYPDARSCVEEAAAEGLLGDDAAGDIDRQLSVGQYVARGRIFASILAACEAEADERA